MSHFFSQPGDLSSGIQLESLVVKPLIFLSPTSRLCLVYDSKIKLFSSGDLVAFAKPVEELSATKPLLHVTIPPPPRSSEIICVADLWQNEVVRSPLYP